MHIDSVYIVAPSILLVVVLVAAFLEKWSVPVILVALGTGTLFGSEVLGWLEFSNVELTKSMANLALAFILFQGGFSTKSSIFKLVALPATGMATWGVVLTAGTAYLVLYKLCQWPSELAMLVAVITSSTDAAATFSILRRYALPPRLSSKLEIESAANDPMAILLTVAVIDAMQSGTLGWRGVVLSFIWKFVAGVSLGWVMGHGARRLFNWLRPQERGLFYIMAFAVVLLIYGLGEWINCSSMLAVFTAGYLMGNRPFVHKQGVANLVGAFSTIAETSMFVMMGLLVSPRSWGGIWIKGVVLFLVLTFVARPVAVALGTLGMRIGLKHKTFITWAGLRGAVPVILATYPSAAGMEIGKEVFNIVFFVVLLSVAIQGSTLGVFARWLQIAKISRPKPLYNLELLTMARSDMDLIVVDIPGPKGRKGKLISELELPPDTVITLVTRGEEVVAPGGSTRLRGWDQVTVLAHVRDEERIRGVLTEKPAV